MLSCEFCKLFKNTYFLEDLQTACSETPVRGSFFKKVASLTAWKLLTVLERNSHRYFSVTLEKFLGKLFYRAPPSNHFSHDAVFFLFADQWGLQPKINSFSGAMVNQVHIKKTTQYYSKHINNLFKINEAFRSFQHPHVKIIKEKSYIKMIYNVKINQIYILL